MLGCKFWTRREPSHEGENDEKIGRMGWKRKRKILTSSSIFSVLLNFFNLVVLGACLIYLLSIPHKHPASRNGRTMPDLIPKGKYRIPSKTPPMLGWKSKLPILINTSTDLTEFSVQRLFMPDDLFNPKERNKKSDDAWETIHKRFVIIDTPGRYGLPPSESFPRGSNSSNEVYAPSVFHQLHCLRLMRFSWYSLIANGPKILTDPIDVPNNPHNEALGPHIEHCFDFLRQALMCHADLALEPFVDSDGVTRISKGSSGWGTVHQCRRWDKVLDWVDNHPFPGFDDEYE